ncbi:MAG TPA: trypsin-like peptidase domain-containing protein [Candidatus Acidoferrum sp.]|nr:trypsin-like peptidase domain-containing protein [Candidatus Acidoferrum sp.]
MTQPEQPNQPQPSQQPELFHSSRKFHKGRFLGAVVLAIIVCGLLAGTLGYWVGNMNSSSNLANLQKQVIDLQNQVASLTVNNTANSQVSPTNVSLSQLYMDVKDSVVVIMDSQSGSPVEGSGFIYNLSGRMVVVTNYHVVASGTNISVTFGDGNGYTATVLGFDAYADLAVLSVDAPASELHPLQVVSSSSLTVGNFVAALGTPFGLAGSMTTGIVSALGRTITETSAGNYPIANVIQISAPINPGNSGGPLLNDQDQVVGINTAGIQNTQQGGAAQGVGFAIPSDTILREISSLVNDGSYTQHSYMGIGVVDVTFDIASKEKLNVTYGVLLQQITSGGPADKAGIKAGATQALIDGNTIFVGGDIITAINGTRIINEDGLSTYLEENTLPNQTINLTILRNGQIINVPLVLGARPAPS